MIITKIKAILSLVPNAQVNIYGNDVQWVNPVIAPVTNEQIDNELLRLTAEYEAKQYQRNRALEYPPYTDYLDGVVKGDQEQIDDYIAACQAVKTKYPKPE